MRIGQLRTLTIIQRHNGTLDGAGQPVDEGWSDFATVWADVRALSGLESIRASAATATVKLSARIWYRADVDASMRAVIEGKVYRITAVLPDMARRIHTDLVLEAAT